MPSTCWPVGYRNRSCVWPSCGPVSSRRASRYSGWVTLSTIVQEVNHGTQLPALQGRVELDQVCFRYRPGGNEVLRDISLAIEPGEVIGIVGRSGSGKSTLTRLIQRLHSPERGRVLLDGADLHWPMSHRCGGRSVWYCRRTCCFAVRCAKILHWPTLRHLSRRSLLRPRWQAHTRSSSNCPRVTKPWSANTARASRVANDNVSR